MASFTNEVLFREHPEQTPGKSTETLQLTLLDKEHLFNTKEKLVELTTPYPVCRIIIYIFPITFISGFLTVNMIIWDAKIL